MQRRYFITLIGGVAAWPLAARAQKVAKQPTIGFLGTTTPSAWTQLVAAFVQLGQVTWDFRTTSVI